jgi:hypothetical protein
MSWFMNLSVAFMGGAMDGAAARGVSSSHGVSSNERSLFGGRTTERREAERNATNTKTADVARSQLVDQKPRSAASDTVIKAHLDKGIEHSTEAAIYLTSAVASAPVLPLAGALTLKGSREAVKALEQFVQAGEAYFESRQDQEQATSMQCWSKD